MKFWRKCRLNISLVLATQLLLQVAMVSSVLARAGGGGGYSGGGSSGGGGGGGGGGELIFYLVYLCIRYPAIGIPIAIVVVAFFFFRGRDTYQSNTIRRGATAHAMNVNRGAAKKLQAADANFDEEVFSSRVSAAFQSIQAAWSSQDLRSVRAFVSDGIYERFSLQLKEQADLGYRNVMENVVVQKAQLAEVNPDPFFDMATLSISASATDYRVHLADNKEINGTRRAENFVEYWTFLRRRGATSKTEQGLIEGFCPNCGDQLELSQSAKCESCQSLLRSGEHDWVLCEITQASEWQPTRSEKIPGVEEFRKNHDAGFNLPHLEDRASVIFWREKMAERLGDVGPLAKMASDEYCESHQARWQQNTGSQRTYSGDAAVGSVTTLGVLPGQDSDRAVVEIRWEGARFIVDQSGKHQATNERAVRRHLYVLGRNSGVESDVKKSVSSSHCPSCGAPESDLTSHACDFCGEVLNRGGKDWVLFEILNLQSPAAQQLMQELRQLSTPVDVSPIGETHGNGIPPVSLDSGPPVPGGVELLSWVVRMALADQVIDDKEKEMMERVARRYRIPNHVMSGMIDAARREESDLPQPKDRNEARRWMAQMADMSLADGKVDQSEFNFLCQAGSAFEYSQYDVKSLLRQRKTKLFQQAKRELRQNRMG